MKRELIILGGGGFAREVAWLAEECALEGLTIAGFVEADGSAQIGRLLNGYPVMDLGQAKARHPGALAVAAVGSPQLREKLVAEAAAAGFGFATLIHPNVARSRRINVGAGTLICAGSILTVDITVGQQVHVNLDCTIGHNAVLEDFATLAPGVHVSGFVHIGKRAYIGTGAVIVNGTEEKLLIIGDDAVVGAGAVVVKDVQPKTTVAGVPARPLKSG